MKIKYRAWNKRLNKFVYDITLNSEGCCTTVMDDDWYDYDKDTISQYMGIEDDNGKEIYEGQVVEFLTNKNDSNSYMTAIVKYSDKFKVWLLESIGDIPKTIYGIGDDMFWDTTEFKIIYDKIN